MNVQLRRLVNGLSPRMRRLLSTTGTSYLARLCAAITLLVTIPLARQYLDPERFGVWMMLSSLLGFFAFADLGLGNSALSRVSQALGRGEHALAAQVMRTSYLCTAAVAMCLGLAWIGYTQSAVDPLAFAGRIGETSRHEVMTACHLFVGLMLLNLPLGLTQKFQLGAQDGHWVGLGQTAASVGTVLALPLAMLLHLSLAWLVLASVGVQTLVNLGSTLWWMYRQGHGTAVRAARATRPLAVDLLTTGSMFFLLQLSAALAFQSDAFVIAQLRGQAEYGDFASVQKIFLSCATLTSAALIGLWPAFADALAKQDFAWARTVLKRALIIGAVIMGMICIALTVSMDWLSRVLLHMTTAPSLTLTALLATWTVVDTLGNICGTLLNGAGILRPQLIAAITMASAAFAGKWLLVDLWGAPGAVAATLLAYLAISVPTLAYLLHRLLAQQHQRPAHLNSP